MSEFALFVVGVLVVAWAVGVFDRSTFDDEVLTLRLVDRFDLLGVFRATSEGFGAHGPLGYTLYEAVSFLPLTGMRLVSMVMSAVAMGLGLDLALAAIDNPRHTERYLWFGAFGLLPLLHGAGDALRSYPLTALLVAVFLWSYLKRGAPGLVGGVALGFAASTTVTPVVPYAAFAWHRYWRLRRFGRTDVIFHLALGAAALPGILNYLRTENSGFAFGNVAEIVGLVTVGGLGGMRVGLSRAVLLLPLFAVVGYLLWVALRRRPDYSELQRSIVEVGVFMLLASYGLAIVSDVGRARTYLFAVPFVLAAVAIGAHSVRGNLRVVVVALAAYVLAFAAFAANFHDSMTPLKRNLAIPYTQAFDFVQSNADGETFIISMDGVLALDLEAAGACVAVSRFRVESMPASPMFRESVPACFSGRLDDFDTVIAVEGLPFGIAPELEALVEDARRSRSIVALARFGEDRDVDLKRILTDEDLEQFILEITVYKNEP